LLVLDLGLPDVDGLTVLDDLAAGPYTGHTPVVVVTGKTDVLDNLNARCILRKPVSPEKVLSVVRDCLASGTASASS
jgi:CheY-like chemotaxis protein